MPTEWMTTGEAADLSGYDLEYVRQLIRAGIIKAEKRGRDWWVDRDAFLNYLRSAKKAKDRRRGPRGALQN